MAKVGIHQRNSALDKNTKIVNVTKEKSLGEKLFGEDDGSKNNKSGRYRIHERDSFLDKDTKVVTVTKEKTLGETLFGTEEEIKEKYKNDKENYAKAKEENKRYIEERNQQMISDYNALLEQEKRFYEEQAYNNKVVGKNFTAGVSSLEYNNMKKSFDYGKVSIDKKRDYVKFVVKYFNASDKGNSINYIRITKKKTSKMQKDQYYDGPKYWEIKKDETEYEKNKGFDFYNQILIIDENGEFWNKSEKITNGIQGVVNNISFKKYDNLEDDNLIHLDILLKKRKVDLSLEKYLKLNKNNKDKLIKDAFENWTDENKRLKKISDKRRSEKHFIELYNMMVLISKVVIFPISVLPVLLVFTKAPLIFIIGLVVTSSAIGGFIKDHSGIATIFSLFCTIVTTVLMLIRGYDHAFQSALIMIALSVILHFILYFAENKISERKDKIKLY